LLFHRYISPGRFGCTRCVYLGLLLQTTHVTYVVCIFVYVEHIGELCCAKTAEPMPAKGTLY